jgi:hypothetical protein
MRISRTAKWVGGGLIAALLLSPVWGFEALYRCGIHGEALPMRVEVTPVPGLMKDALWIATGEVPGDEAEPLWVGNFFRSAHGGAATASLARRIVYRDPQRRLRNLEHHLRLAAVAVWLSRHATEGELKQYLAQWTYFGRNAWGASDAARAFFERPIENLTLAEIALLAGLPQAPSGLDPTCHPERAEKRRAYVLARLRDLGLISRSAYETANAEPIKVLPKDMPCDHSP